MVESAAIRTFDPISPEVEPAMDECMQRALGEELGLEWEGVVDYRNELRDDC